MRKIFVDFKPKLWCLMLHQVGWMFHAEQPEISYCPYCKKNFFYPTKKEHFPVYKK